MSANKQVVLIHGWSETKSSEAFRSLVDFLESHGFNAVSLWLGDYISLEDDVRIEDVARRMETVIREELRLGRLSPGFSIIAHSTGGLVTRRWVSEYYPGGTDCPARRLLMLAPANFGSPLALMGQSMLGRLVKGWRNWFHTGKEMLTALAPASRFQWDLAQSDLFVPESVSAAPTPYGSQKVMPFVITGTHPYTSLLRQIVNENGSDGTVRVPAANLNTKGVTIDFAANEVDPKLTPWPLRHGDLQFPFAVLPDRTHSSILNPLESDVASSPASQAKLSELILEALNCPADAAAYSGLATKWRDLSEATAKLSGSEQLIKDTIPAGADPEFFHQYMQVVVKVVDDHGAEVNDYFLEFFAPDARSDDDTVYFHSEVIEAVKPGDGPVRCLYIDRTDLVDNYYGKINGTAKKEVAMSISATAPGSNTSYFRNSSRGAAGHVLVHQEENGAPRWLQRNTTHFVKIIIPRVPKDNVFALKPV